MAARPGRAEDGREGRRTAGPAGTATTEVVTVGPPDERGVRARGVPASDHLTGREPAVGAREPGPRRSDPARTGRGSREPRSRRSPTRRACRPTGARTRADQGAGSGPGPSASRSPARHSTVRSATRPPSPPPAHSCHPSTRPPPRVAGGHRHRRSVAPEFTRGMTTEYANAERGNSEEHGDAPGRAGRGRSPFPAVPLRHTPVPPGLGQMTPRRPSRAAWKPVVRVQGGAMNRQIRIRTSRRTTTGRDVRMEIDRRTPSGRILPY